MYLSNCLPSSPQVYISMSKVPILIENIYISNQHLLICSSAHLIICLSTHLLIYSSAHLLISSSMPFSERARLSARFRETPSTSAIISVCPSASNCKTLSSVPKWSVNFLAKPAPTPGKAFRTMGKIVCQGVLKIGVAQTFTFTIRRWMALGRKQASPLQQRIVGQGHSSRDMQLRLRHRSVSLMMRNRSGCRFQLHL